MDPGPTLQLICNKGSKMVVLGPGGILLAPKDPKFLS